MPPTWLCILALSLAAAHDASSVAGAAERSNVLFIAVDDLNDWVGALGGHPQARTPNIDRLAGRGTNFSNAHCQAPICNPSRISLLTGRLPSSTGVYYLTPLLRQFAGTRDLVALPQYFQHHGYATLGAGKVFHASGRKEFAEYGGTFGGFGPRPQQPLNAGHTHPLWDWGVFPEQDEPLADFQLAKWAADQLSRDFDRPFFLAVGFYRPHVPLYAPQNWFDEFPLEEVQLPAHRTDDLEDVPIYGRDLSWSAVAPRHAWMIENDQWKRAVQAYLASVKFVDAQIGKVLDALETSEYADDTIVVLWSDHGFHLGTKQRWGKRSLWEAATRVVLMASGPGVAAGQTCGRPVGLIDLYPTLIELCGLPARNGLEGRSLVPLLRNPAAAWPWPAITTFGQHNHAVRSQHRRYIRYADGSEELYDHRVDPHEYDNIADEPRYDRIVAQHRRWLPKRNLPKAPGSTHADARPGSAADIDSPPKVD